MNFLIWFIIEVLRHGAYGSHASHLSPSIHYYSLLWATLSNSISDPQLLLLGAAGATPPPPQAFITSKLVLTLDQCTWPTFFSSRCFTVQFRNMKNSCWKGWVIRLIFFLNIATLYLVQLCTLWPLGIRARAGRVFAVQLYAASLRVGERETDQLIRRISNA
jgi:hypothetical protein